MAIRVKSGLILLVGFTLMTGAWALEDVADRGSTDRRQETLRYWNEERLAGVKPHLPEYGVVGFFDKDHPGDPNPDYYYLAQYVVAPVIIDPKSTDLDMVIGVFPEDSEPPAPPSSKHEVVMEDKSRGIICWKVKGCR
jgi:hypothetical protein